MNVNKLNNLQNVNLNAVKNSRTKKEPEEGNINPQTGSDGVSFSSEKVIMPPDLRKVNINQTLIQFAESLEKPAAGGEKDWTVLFYMDGANDLEPFIARSMMELEKVGSNENVNLVAQMARISQDELKNILEKKYDKPIDPQSNQYYTNIDGDWRGVRRYYITKNHDPGNRRYSSNMEKNLYLQDISHPQTLADFVSWGIKKYPAKHYMLVVMDHGAGWPGALNNEFSGTSGQMMSTPSIENALETAEKTSGKKLDIVHFATCLMGSAEVAYQIKDSANYMVASEEAATTDALDYKNIIEKLTLEIKHGQATPEKVAKMLVAHFADEDNKGAFLTHAAVDLKKMGNVKDCLNKFAEALKKTNIPMAVIKENFSLAQDFGKPAPFRPFKDYRDLKEVAKVIMEDDRIQKQDKDLTSAASSLYNAVDEAVIAKTPPGIFHKEEKMNVKTIGRKTITHWIGTEEEVHGNGLSIYLPLEKNETYNKLKDSYTQLDMSKDTQWDEFLDEKMRQEYGEQLKLFDV